MKMLRLLILALVLAIPARAQVHLLVTTNGLILAPPGFFGTNIATLTNALNDAGYSPGGGSGNASTNASQGWASTVTNTFNGRVVFLGDTLAGSTNLVAKLAALEALFSSYQPLDTDLTAIAAIAGAAGDILYHNGTNWVKLTIGGDGLVLKATNGLPVWGAIVGTGDVVGPASSTDSVVALFDGTTGKLLKNGTLTEAAISANLTETEASLLYQRTNANLTTLATLNGAVLTNLNASELRSGTVPTNRLAASITGKQDGDSDLSDLSSAGSTGTGAFVRADAPTTSGTWAFEAQTVGTMTVTNPFPARSITNATASRFAVFGADYRLTNDVAETGTGAPVRAVSPALTGSPTVPTSAPGTSNTVAASTKYVDDAVAAAPGGGDVATDAIWDAAGDLAVGTGANTAAKLAVGTIGTSLISNGTTPSWWSPRNWYFEWDDFAMYSTTPSTRIPWSFDVNAGGTTTLSAGETNAPGVMALAISTTSSSRATFYHNTDTWLLCDGNTNIMRFRIRVSALSDATDTYIIRAGWLDTRPDAESTDAVGVRYTHSATNGNWQFYCRNNAAETSVDTSTAPSTSYQWFDVLVNSSTSAQCYINGSLVGTITANIPNGPTRTVWPGGCGITRTAGNSNARTLYVDYWELQRTVIR